MSPDLTILCIIGTWTFIVGFVAYWSGINKAEARARAERERLMDDLDEAVTFIAEASARPVLHLVGGAR